MTTITTNATSQFMADLEKIRDEADARIMPFIVRAEVAIAEATPVVDFATELGRVKTDIRNSDLEGARRRFIQLRKEAEDLLPADHPILTEYLSDESLKGLDDKEDVEAILSGLDQEIELAKRPAEDAIADLAVREPAYTNELLLFASTGKYILDQGMNTTQSILGSFRDI